MGNIEEEVGRTPTPEVRNYNYDKFIPKNFGPLMRFHLSPEAGKPSPDFPLWDLETGAETPLHEVLKANPLTVVEFGSFT